MKTTRTFPVDHVKSISMIEPLHPGYSGTTQPHVTSLQSLVNQLLRHSLSDMMQRSDSSVINEIPAELCTIVEESKVTPVIKELLAAVVANARRGRIHIRAERFRDIIILEIVDQSNYNGYALDYSIRSIEPLARMAGGYISLKDQQRLETSITFSFPDQAASMVYEF